MPLTVWKLIHLLIPVLLFVAACRAVMSAVHPPPLSLHGRRFFRAGMGFAALALGGYAFLYADLMWPFLGVLPKAIFFDLRRSYRPVFFTEVLANALGAFFLLSALWNLLPFADGDATEVTAEGIGFGSLLCFVSVLFFFWLGVMSLGGVF